MTNYGIFFTRGSQVIRLPLNPSELPDIQESTNETYNILGIGEVTAIRTPAQRKITISGLFPAMAESFVHTQNNFWTPEQYINFFRSAMNDRATIIYTPVRYREDGSPFATSDVGFPCTVEGFEVREKGGETGDFWYSLSIREYRDYSPQAVKVAFKNNIKTVTQTSTRDIPKDVIVVGDKVEVNGVVTQTPSGSGTSKKVTGTTATVVRKDTSKPQPIAVKDEAGVVSYAKEVALKLAQNTLRATGLPISVSSSTGRIVATSYSDRA